MFVVHQIRCLGAAPTKSDGQTCKVNDLVPALEGFSMNRCIGYILHSEFNALATLWQDQGDVGNRCAHCSFSSSLCTSNSFLLISFDSAESTSIEYQF